MSNLRLLKRTDSRGLLCRSSTNIVPTTIEIGLCAVCDRAVDAPLVLADGKVYTAKGMANFQEVEAGVSMETGYSNALACNGCRLLVHRSCMQSIDDHCRCVFDDLKIHETFFRFWTSVLRSYRSYLITPAVKSATNNCSLPSESATIAQKTAGQGGSVNNKTGKEHGSGGSSKKWALFPFISSSGTKSLPKQLSSDDVFHRSEFLEHAFHDYESRTFMRRLCETQAFAKFVYDRVDRPRFDYEVLFFDEAINAKLNRSLIKIHKEATPFLEVWTIFNNLMFSF
jgi:hypothetical protein